MVVAPSKNARRWLGRMRLRSAEEPFLDGLRDDAELHDVEYETRELLELFVGAEPELALHELVTLAESDEEKECGDAA
jgi:hypothetical protein